MGRCCDCYWYFGAWCEEHDHEVYASESCDRFREVEPSEGQAADT